MRLVSLTANRESFHSIVFNKTGVSIILGRKTSKDARKTYNGVGKSLCIELIHFCLGGSQKPIFEDKIPGWQFNLAFGDEDSDHVISRSTNHQEVFVLDDEECKEAQVRKRLKGLLFASTPKMGYLTFRLLLPQFVRQGRAAYISFDTLNGKEKPYQKQLRAAYLLGLDVSLCDQKYKLKRSLDSIVKWKGALKKDMVLREYLAGGDGNASSSTIGLQDLTEQIDRIRANIDGFHVAEDFRDVQQGADAIRARLQGLRMKSMQFKRSVDNISKSLRMQTDVSAEDVIGVYAEANVAFPDAVVRKLDDVVNFRRQLLEKRRVRLSSERIRIVREMSENEASIEQLSGELNGKLAYLDSHGALGELLDLMNYLADLERKADRLKELGNLEKEYRKKERKAKADMLRESASAEDHLEEIESRVREHLDRFRGYSRRFYPNKPGGLTVVNNDGENQLRYDIDAHIQDDASDGINEVKIFCYDMTLLESKGVHDIDFVFHDSRLFANVDPRQRAQIFRIAMDMGRQYIVSLNEDQIEGMKEYLSESECERLEACVVAELTDKDSAGKLLGIQVDMQYED